MSSLMATMLSSVNIGAMKVVSNVAQRMEEEHDK